MATDGQQFVENLKKAAAVMGAYIPPERWPGWAIYLLEALQVETNAEHYEEFLRNLQAAIKARLEDGRW